ncbi:MAG TPA: FAD-dependent tricarballylate dehydrogenase TcuA [Chloroflexota bacterium]|nr:FAD-dependent tricarballylate dehydrogenase TcuA [Chloroflexota bacterium]
MTASAADYDVVVLGAGNAALCAALAARERGARVLVVEKAPEEERGGNSAFTGGLFRFPFDSAAAFPPLLPHYSAQELAAVEIPAYPRASFEADLERVTEGLSDPLLVDLLLDNAYGTMRWLTERGVRWMLATGRQAFRVGDKHHFFGNLILEANGGGRGLSDREFELAEQAGIDIWYDCKPLALCLTAAGAVEGVEVRRPGAASQLVAAGSVVLACGGFEANTEMRTRYLGPDWELAKVRGSRFNTGDGIRLALEAGAQSYGHWSCAHAVQWDLLAPPTGNLEIGDLYQKHSYPLGIMVNKRGERFVDEGADLRNYTYAKYGREVLRQPERAAFQIFDSKTVPLLRDEYRIREATRARANTIAELADQLTIDAAGLAETVERYNAAVQSGTFNPSILDGLHTSNLTPPKSNWALKIDEPPFEGYAVTCGITFTFGGLRIDGECRVQDTELRPIPGLYAAGEIVGGLFYHNYPGGSGLMAGATFGRLAGGRAAERTLGQPSA